jgi:predicted DNA-binding protein with PD1-like motif
MEYKRFGDRYVVKLKRGEEVVSKIKEFADAENITSASISGIGTVNNVGLALYDGTKHHEVDMNEDFEILSLLGNITMFNEETTIHMSIGLSDKDYNVKGGHLTYAYVSGTAEIFVDPIEGEITRVYDSETGLKLMELR